MHRVRKTGFAGKNRVLGHQGVMIRTSAAVRCQYGDGRVFAFSPHPEMTEGKEHLIPLVVRWAAGERGKK
jgi:hypothetical protein